MKLLLPDHGSDDSVEQTYGPGVARGVGRSGLSGKQAQRQGRMRRVAYS